MSKCLSAPREKSALVSLLFWGLLVLYLMFLLGFRSGFLLLHMGQTYDGTGRSAAVKQRLMVLLVEATSFVSVRRDGRGGRYNSSI